jgi:hypothetical protein
MGTKRKIHSASFKARVALEAYKADKILWLVHAFASSHSKSITCGSQNPDNQTHRTRRQERSAVAPC